MHVLPTAIPRIEEALEEAHAHNVADLVSHHTVAAPTGFAARTPQYFSGWQVPLNSAMPVDPPLVRSHGFTIAAVSSRDRCETRSSPGIWRVAAGPPAKANFSVLIVDMLLLQSPDRPIGDAWV
jgi:hypothetical protein